MVVLSLFDGIAAGYVALKKAGIPVDKYYSSEIDSKAAAIASSNFPDIIPLGDIRGFKSWSISSPDLILAGSPCQGFSKAGKLKNLTHDQSKLILYFFSILRLYKPKYFLFENVCMPSSIVSYISKEIGSIYPHCVTQLQFDSPGSITPIYLNSSLVSAQNRLRMYWTNLSFIHVVSAAAPVLTDILTSVSPVSKYHNPAIIDLCTFKRGCAFYPSITSSGFIKLEINDCIDLNFKNSLSFRGRLMRYKSHTVTKKSCAEFYLYDIYQTFRKFTPLEAERLQTLPDHYTDGYSDYIRFGVIGNSWTVNIIAGFLNWLVSDV